MIIKRKNAGQLLPKPGEMSPGDAQDGQREELPMEWSIENIEAGLVPERRKEDQEVRNDRRRGYRRIEDRNLISKAWEEANAIRENAQSQGFQEGLKQAESVTEELRDTIARLINAREEALLSITDEIAGIAVEVASRIIKTEVACDDTLVMGLVRDTIQKAGRSNKTILIKLHPEDTATVKRLLKEDPIPNMNAELIVMDDPTVDQGSCIIETNSGLIDASFSTQLGTLRQLFGTKETGNDAGGPD